jgi:hypothetical protein
MDDEIIKFNDESGYDRLIIKRKWTTLDMSSVDKDGDIEIELDDSRETISLYITQNEIKEIIEFLQKQIISPS